MGAFPLGDLGGRQTGPSSLRFGVLLPWVTPDNGQAVHVLAIHERDQYLQEIPAVEISLQHSAHPEYGDLWSGDVDLTAARDLPGQSHWGTPGRYAYRLAVTDPNRGRIDWVIDPYARDFGVGKQSAVVVGAQPYRWSVADGAWRVPELRDLIMYEINLAEFHVDLAGAIERLDYLADLGVNCLSIMPVTNVASQVDWGYLPVGYFGVDERFGGGDSFKAFVDAAHARGLAVIVDAVYGHASRALFAYQYLYDRLGYNENPFMGPFAKDYFANQGASTDFSRPLVQDFFLAVNQYWLEEFHVDGFRYDCVPNYWDGATGAGYAKLVYDTHNLVDKSVANGALLRFRGPDAVTLIQCAEQLEDPVGILWQSYSDTTWQNGTLAAAHAVARGEDGAIDRFGQALGLSGFPAEVTLNGQVFPRTALQYLEDHDNSRLLAEFGASQPDEAGDYLFLLGDRNRWHKLQPYLIGLLCAKGIPMLYEGEELGEDFTLPGYGLGRVGLLRPVNWDYFYDDPGRTLVALVRKLLRLRRQRDDLRRGDHWYYADAAAYQNRGVMIFRRSLATDSTVIAVNFTDADATVPFTMPSAGEWTERLHGQGSLVTTRDQELQLTIPSNYGRIWTLA
ncbi:MAG TPA: alpha-amylase family glycosyl hydrolase [Streptosporangiaceae bacterium]